MGKFFIKFFSISLLALFIIIIFLSYYGLETNRFNTLIKSKANEVNNNIRLEFEETKIHLNIKESNLIVKLHDPKVLIKNDEVDLSKLDLFISLKSFFSSRFSLTRAEIAFEKNDVKDITKVANIFFPRIISKQLNKIFKKGNLEGEFIIPFASNGTIAKNYRFSGKISDATISLTKKFSIKNLTMQVNHGVHLGSDEFATKIEKGSLFDLSLAESSINFRNSKNGLEVKSMLRTRGKINFSQVKLISSLFGFNINFINDVNANSNLTSNINFNIDKKFKIRNLSYSTEGNIDSLVLFTKEKKVIKNYLPQYDPKINLKNTKIKFIKEKSNQTLELVGLIKTKDQFDNFEIKGNYSQKSKAFNITGNIDLKNLNVNISKLNYKKYEGIKADLNFDLNFLVNKYYNINSIKFLTNNSKIYLSNVKLNKKLEVIDLDKLEIKTFIDKVKNNDFLIKKVDKIVVSGEVFDAQSLLKHLYKKDDKKTFSKNFNSDIKINFETTLTGTDDDISDFGMIASIKNGSYEKLSLKGKFSESEIIEMSIYQTDDSKKTLQIISDRARPFIKNFDFIKGFQGGNLEYESVTSKESSSSILKINNFKVSKVPALAKLLTLASLQGIADTLSGEGIRFESFEMKSNSKGNVIKIEEALAIGPAVSILLEGYVDKGVTVSLRGTLVPATKLNSIIASIPLVGDILVGKKAGEGVVGVSFKMKGPPKDIKTTVNPIKTLTPRFIVRAVEKMKKQKKEEIK